MKNLILLVLCFFGFTSLVYSQELNTTQYKKENSTTYQVSIGVNTVNNVLRSPLSNPGDWAFKNPITVGIEARDFYTKDLALVLDFGYNEYDSGMRYFSLDGSFKYYLNDWIKSKKLEIAPMAGGGAFNFDRTNISFNLGGSVAYWFSDKIGVRIKSLAKFAFNQNDENYNIANGHYQHFLELVFKL